MKILSSEQMRKADSATIENEPVSALELMERAGRACFEWILIHSDHSKKYVVVCGSGNNGGDGLVIARMLAAKRLKVRVVNLQLPNQSICFSENLEAIRSYDVEVIPLDNPEAFYIDSDEIVIDAIFGSGLSKPIDGWIGEIVKKINASGQPVISIDMPSGLFSETHSNGCIVKARHTLTFQNPALSFMFADSGNYAGDFHVLDIGLDKKFIEEITCQNFYIDEEVIKSIIRPRDKFAHKGSFGHSLLVCGSHGKMGAALLAARACLRSGTGLLTIHIPSCGYEIIQSGIPEALVSVDSDQERITQIPTLPKVNALGIGPGIGLMDKTRVALLGFLKENTFPVVLDADALNILSDFPDALKLLQPNTILTPHPREFERLFGRTENGYEQFLLLKRVAAELKVIIILKGAHTCIATPEGNVFFNSTGNPAMAKGGTGDVLTGMITALLAQKYSCLEASILGVYLHGMAGDIAGRVTGSFSMLASDLIERIPDAFLKYNPL